MSDSRAIRKHGKHSRFSSFVVNGLLIENSYGFLDSFTVLFTQYGKMVRLTPFKGFFQSETDSVKFFGNRKIFQISKIFRFSRSYTEIIEKSVVYFTFIFH